jgi:hypothetical protein
MMALSPRQAPRPALAAADPDLAARLVIELPSGGASRAGPDAFRIAASTRRAMLATTRARISQPAGWHRGSQG